MSLQPSLNIGYDVIHCDRNDADEFLNMWECHIVREATGKCMPSESAGVSCGNLPVEHSVGR